MARAATNLELCKNAGVTMYDHAVIVLGCGIDAVSNLNDDAKGSVQLGIAAYRQSDKACIIMSGHVSYKADFTPSIS